MTFQRGFGAIAAIVVLVILAVLAGAIMAISTTQQTSAAQDVLSARAWQTARAGNEWGLFQALRKDGIWTDDPACDDLTTPHKQKLDLSKPTGFWVTVTCESWLYNEGEEVPGTPQKVRVYRITAVACPAADCPVNDANVAGAGYIERTRVVVATKYRARADLFPD